MLSSVDAGPDQNVNEGDLVSLTAATFIDPAAPSSYTVSVDWGDGTVNNTPVVIRTVDSEPISVVCWMNITTGRMELTR